MRFGSEAVIGAATDTLLSVLAHHRRHFQAPRLKAAATELLAKATAADALDRRLAAGYRDRAAALLNETEHTTNA